MLRDVIPRRGPVCIIHDHKDARMLRPVCSLNYSGKSRPRGILLITEVTGWRREEQQNRSASQFEFDRLPIDIGKIGNIKSSADLRCDRLRLSRSKLLVLVEEPDID